jgi:hypothetical protein
MGMSVICVVDMLPRPVAKMSGLNRVSVNFFMLCDS